jgi:hypothetical protein
MKPIFALFAVATLLSACTHNHKIVKQPEVLPGIKVSIGAKEITTNDIVDVFIPKCHVIIGGRGQKNKECHSTKVGEAKVIEVLDEHHTLVVPLQNLQMSTDMTVEKKK